MKPSILPSIYVFASIAPLTASLIAPLAVLLDIPALTEKWYTRNGKLLPDPKASLILSGLSLGFSLIANVLLVIRLSLRGEGWKIATQISVVCWIVKVVTGITNLIVFGALTRNEPQFSYAEGFWSAVISLIASGIILSLLVLHWAVEFKRDPPKQGSLAPPAHKKLQIRVAGRHFMLQNTLLIALIGLNALIFSRIENWTYLQGIYFTTVTFLTIGFGDFYPTKASTKILLFPLGLLGITLLAGCISTIVSFFRKNQREHKAKARAERERAWQISEMTSDEPSLEREIDFLSKLHERQGWREQAVDLSRSLVGFLVFWFAGAAIFGAVESWTYGNSLYFCYVFFLSIGYGDFAPVSSAGRVIFIVYSVIAVPVMASFAVSALQNVMERVSEKRMDQRHTHVINRANPQPKTPIQRGGNNLESNAVKEEVDEMHSALIFRYHSRIQAAEEDAEATIRAGDLKALLEHAVALERTARRLLVAHLEEGSRAQILLRADWNIQLRNLHALKSEPRKNNSRSQVAMNGGSNGPKKQEQETGSLAAAEAGIAGDSEESEEREEAEIAKTALGGMDEEETLQAVREFRKNVAGVLALGSHLRGLEGVEKYMFERSRKEVEDKLQQ